MPNRLERGETVQNLVNGNPGTECLMSQQVVAADVNVAGLARASFTWFLAHNPAGYADAHPQHEFVSNLFVPFSNTRQVLSMDIRGDWYTGAAAGGIGGAQIDYLTVAIQEFGHLLGLGHNGNASAGHAADEALSPMNGLLPIGNALRRTPQPSDIVAITHLYGIPEPSSIMLAVMAFGCLIASGSRKR